MELRYSLGKFSTSSSLGLSVFIAELISGILVADTALYHSCSLGFAVSFVSSLGSTDNIRGAFCRFWGHLTLYGFEVV